MNIALAQLNFTVGDIEGNCKKIKQALKQGEKAGFDLLLFPELALTGYPPEDLVLKKSFVKSNLRALDQIASQTKQIAAILGFVDAQDERIFNAAALLSEGKVAGIYHKIALPNYGVFDEKRLFTPGSKAMVYDFMEAKVGVTICEDIWETQKVAPAYTHLSPNIMVNLSASPFHQRKQKERENVARSFVQKTQSALAYINLVGGQDELVFDGGSFFISWDGSLALRAPQFKAGTWSATVNILQKEAAGICASILSEEEELFQALVLGTRDYVRKNGFKKVLIGLSGGIDSSLVACIAAKAVGKNNVVGVFMPSPFTSKESEQDVKELVRHLEITCHTLPIASVLESYKKVLAPLIGKKMHLAYENIQARIRGMLLMALSNYFGYLVLATGNKSEVSVGYATLYGDMAGGFAPIADLFKQQVYQVARYLNRKAVLIPENVLTKPPTAELRPGQKDTDSLPPYPQLDSVLEEVVEKLTPVEEICQRVDPDLVKKITMMVDRNEYKRRQKPPGIKVSQRAFGRDRRMPITNRFHG